MNSFQAWTDNLMSSSHNDKRTKDMHLHSMVRLPTCVVQAVAYPRIWNFDKPIPLKHHAFRIIDRYKNCLNLLIIMSWPAIVLKKGLL